jgi:hypothetical protein
MCKVLEVLSELNKGNSCKLYILDSEVNQLPNYYLLYRFSIGIDGQLEINKEVENYDRPYLIRGEINKNANIIESREMLKYPSDELTTPIITLLYCSLFITDSFITPGERGEVSYFDNSLALNQFFTLASSMLSTSNNGTIKIGYDIVDRSMLQIIKSGDDGFYNILANKAQYFKKESDSKLDYNQMMQNLENSLEDFADKFD